MCKYGTDETRDGVQAEFEGWAANEHGVMDVCFALIIIVIIRRHRNATSPMHATVTVQQVVKVI